MVLQALKTQIYNPVFSNPDFRMYNPIIRMYNPGLHKECIRISFYSSPNGSFHILKNVQYFYSSTYNEEKSFILKR